MNDARESTPPSSSSRVEEIFLAWLEQNRRGESESFEELRRRHVTDAEELDRLAARFERARATLSRLSASPPSDPSGAQEAARYEVRGEIARGGMGVVLEVYDPSLRRTLAMKRLIATAGEGLIERLHRERRRSRLLAEAQILGQLDHPGVVPVIEAGEDERGELFFTMRRVRGRDFGAVIDAVHGRSATSTRDEAWTLVRAVNVLLRVCEAVAYAHEKGVVHRDLKPSNVMVGRFGETYVMDWGLAHARGGASKTDTDVSVVASTAQALRRSVVSSDAENAKQEGAAREPSSALDAASLSLVRTTRTEESSAASSSALPTLEGEVVGTPAYMPPEQASGRLDDVDQLADVYALGAMLYHLLSGARPYATPNGSTTTGEATLELVLRGPPEPLRRVAARAPDELVSITEKAMARDRERRYSSVLELSNELRAWLEGRVVRAHASGPFTELAKWVKRNKGAAAAIAMTIAALAGISILQTVLKGQVETEDYYNRIALAVDALDAGETKHARELLAGCAYELRGWEWRHLNSRLDTSVAVIPGAGRRKLCFTPDGASLIGFPSSDSGPWPDDLRIWDPATRTLTAQCDTQAKGTGAMRADGRMLAQMIDHDAILLLDARSLELQSRMPTRQCTYAMLSFAPVGNLLAATGARPIEIWNTGSHELLHYLDAGQGHTVEGVWSGDGRVLYCPAHDGSISVWDVERGRLIQLIHEDHDRITAFSASPDGLWLASADWEKQVRVWNARELRTETLLGTRRHLWGDLVWSPDSRILAMADGPVVRRFEAGTWRELEPLVGHEWNVESIAFHPTDGTLVTCGREGSLRIWKPEHGEAALVPPRVGSEPNKFATSADGRIFAVAWKAPAVIDVVRPESGTRRRVSMPSRCESLAFTPDGRKLLAQLGDGRVVTIDVDTGSTIGELPASGTDGFSIAPDGVRIFACNKGRASVWNLEHGTRVWCEPPEHATSKDAAITRGGAWSPDGGELVTFDAEGSIHVRDSSSGRLLRSAPRRDEPYSVAAFTPDGAGLLVGSVRPGTLELRDARTLEVQWVRPLVLELTNPMFQPSPDGERIFLLGASGDLEVLDLHTGRLIVSLPTDRYPWAKLSTSEVGDAAILMSNRGIRYWRAAKVE